MRALGGPQALACGAVVLCLLLVSLPCALCEDDAGSGAGDDTDLLGDNDDARCGACCVLHAWRACVTVVLTNCMACTDLPGSHSLACMRMHASRVPNVLHTLLLLTVRIWSTHSTGLRTTLASALMAVVGVDGWSFSSSSVGKVDPDYELAQHASTPGTAWPAHNV